MINDDFLSTIVLLFVAIGWIWGGYWMIRYPDKAIELNERQTDARTWDRFVRIGFARPTVYRVIGCIVFPVGLAMLVWAIFGLIS